MNIFIPITKVDVDKRLVYGILNEETPDKSGEIMDYASAKPAFQKWSDEQSEASGGKSLGNVRAMHGSIAAGKLTDLSFDDDNKRVEGCAKIIDDAEWQKVLEGVYTGFSIGGGYANRWSDPADPMGVMRYTPTLSEVSIVDNPCHAGATFQIIKKDGSTELRKFNQPKTNEDTMTTSNVQLAKDGKPTKPQSAPLQKWLAADDTPFNSKREAEIHNLELEAIANVPGLKKVDDMLNRVKITQQDEHPAEEEMLDEIFAEGEEADKAKKRKDLDKDDMAMTASEKAMKEKDEAKKKKAADTHADEPNEDDETLHTDEKVDSEEDKEEADEKDDKRKGKEGEKAKKSTTSILTKKKEPKGDDGEGDMEPSEGEDEDGDENKKNKKADKDGEKKKPDGDVEYADEGHQDDGKKRYPLDTEEHIRAAWSYINMPKNGAMYDAADLKSVKAKIVSAWKEEIDAKGPPSADDEKAMKSLRAETLAKGMDTIAQFAHKLQHISFMIDSSESEAAREGDDSDVPAKLKAWLADGIPIFMDMCKEETDELLDGDDDDVMFYTECVPMFMSADLPKGSLQVLAKSIRQDFARPLVKSDSRAEADKGQKLLKLASSLAKVGARHSEHDMDKMADMHKAMVDHHDEMKKCMDDHMDKMAECFKDLGFEAPEANEEDKGPAVQKMSKLISTLNLALAKEAAREKVDVKINDAFEKSTQTIEKLLNKIEQQDARIEHLEGQPAPSKGNVRSFSKADDSNVLGHRANTSKVEAALEKMSPEEKAKVLMKASLSNPRQMSDFRS